MPCLIDNNSSTADVFCCIAHSLVDQTVHLFWIYWNVAHRTVPVAPELYNVASKMLSCTEVRRWLYMDPQEHLHMFLRDNTVLLCSSCQQQPVTLHQRRIESVQKRLSAKKLIVSTEEHSECIVNDLVSCRQDGRSRWGGRQARILLAGFGTSCGAGTGLQQRL